MTTSPLVTVVIATYNWSTVLRYSIQSVLWQTFQDWELLVVGDACTDDSEQVVASFNDPRIRWHNRPENSGSQAGPNNTGNELARGQYVAYLGHDDLWYFDHLEQLVQGMQETGCDFAFAITEYLRGNVDPSGFLLGLSPFGGYEYGVYGPPSSWMHKAGLLRDVGQWRDFRTQRISIDVEFLNRVYHAGKKIHLVKAMTVVKFPAGLRKNSYVEKPSHEQAEYAARMRDELEFRYHELIRMMSHPWYVKRLFRVGYTLSGDASPGALINYYRAQRGLPEKPGFAPEPEEPLFRNHALLKLLNTRVDIAPNANIIQLYQSTELPQDGLFVGFGWHAIEETEWGRYCRWAPGDVEIVVTKPTGRQRRLLLEIGPGPGVGFQPFTLDVLDETGAAVVSADITGSGGMFEIELPIEAGEGRIFTLHTGSGGQVTEGDGRILNFIVYRFGWVHAATLHARWEAADARAALAQAKDDLAHAKADYAAGEAEMAQSLAQAQRDLRDVQAAAEQLERFRRTSLRYWAARVRTSPKLRRWLRLPPPKS